MSGAVVTQARGDGGSDQDCSPEGGGKWSNSRFVPFSFYFSNVYVLLKYFINTGCRCILKIVPTGWMWDVRCEMKNSAHRLLA